MDSKELFDLFAFLLVVIIAAGGVFLLRRLVFGGSRIKQIIQAEKNRQEHPDAQNGKFTRLYTMPYCEDLNEENIRRYCNEHLPAYHCSVSKNKVRISESRTGLNGEVRELYITHLKEHNISAIDLVNPKEVEYNSQSRQSSMRSSLYDMGFGKDIREMIRVFQQNAVAHSLS